MLFFAFASRLLIVTSCGMLCLVYIYSINFRSNGGQSFPIKVPGDTGNVSSTMLNQGCYLISLSVIRSAGSGCKILVIRSAASGEIL